MKSKLLHSLASLFGLLFFCGALWVLHHELKVYHLDDMFKHLKQLPAYLPLEALLVTFLSYLMRTGYDTLALQHIQHPLSYGKTALTSFIGYAFSNNMGLGMITGAPVRYRLYSSWGLSALEITNVIAFCTLTFWIGFFTLGGLVFILEPVVVPKALHLPFGTAHPVGIVFLAVVLAYFLWNVLRRRPLKAGRWEFPLPSLRIHLIQIAIALLDWALAGAALYVLLPPAENLSYPGFLGIYLLAQTAGLISQVPGGLGVFETMVILLLSPTVPPPAILGALLVYRGIYYILPLLLAVTLLGTQEIVRRREIFQYLAQIFVRGDSKE